MRLYLVRHGEATPKEVNPARPLTGKGREDVQKVATFLKKAGIGPLPVRHSGKMRTRETAEIIASLWEAPSLVRAGGKLGPQDPVHPLVQEISGLDSDFLVAGHLPFLGKLASALLTGSESQNLLSFRQGGVVCLNRNEDRTWQVAWMVIPDILRP
jgi:phosphohistidine phosphatase